MRHFAARTNRILWVLHVAVTSTWLGCLVAMITLALTARDASASVSASTWADVAKIENVTAAMAVTTIVLGLIQSLWGGWGFVRHRWLLVKWLLALATVISGAAVVHPGSRALADSTTVSGTSTVITAVLLAQLAALLVALVLSRFKPWRGRSSRAS